MDTLSAREDHFPARSRAATGQVRGIDTNVSVLEFSDKILLTVSQGGRLSQWVRNNNIFYPISSFTKSPNA